MPKNAVFPYMMFTHFVDEPTLKKLALFFDNIYVSEFKLMEAEGKLPGKEVDYIYHMKQKLS